MIFDITGKMEENVLKKLEGKNVLVIGDLVLDNFIWGRVKRLSTEAPVPKVEVINKKAFLGGIGNIASMIKSLKAKPYVVGVVGKDEAAKITASLLSDKGIQTNYIVYDHTRPTVKKTRILVKNQYLTRLDYGSSEKLNERVEGKIKRDIERLIPKSDIVIVGDYGEGFLTKELMYYIIKLCDENNKKVIVRPFKNHKSYYMGAYMVVPTYHEAIKMSGYKDDFQLIDNMGEELAEYFNSHILIDLHAKGAAFFNKHGKAFRTPASVKRVVDTTSSRNIFIGTVALGISAGLEIEEAVKIAKLAEDLSLTKMGTVEITLDEIKTALKLNRNIFV